MTVYSESELKELLTNYQHAVLATIYRDSQDSETRAIIVKILPPVIGNRATVEALQKLSLKDGELTNELFVALKDRKDCLPF